MQTARQLTESWWPYRIYRGWSCRGRLVWPPALFLPPFCFGPAMSQMMTSVSLLPAHSDYSEQQNQFHVTGNEQHAKYSWIDSLMATAAELIGRPRIH